MLGTDNFARGGRRDAGRRSALNCYVNKPGLFAVRADDQSIGILWLTTVRLAVNKYVDSF